MYRLIFFLSISISLLQSQALFKAEPDVRVRIINTTQNLDITFNGFWNITDNSGKKPVALSAVSCMIKTENDRIIISDEDGQITASSDSLILQGISDTGTVTIKDVPYGVGWWWEGKEDRTYEGKISIIRSGDSLQVVVKLPLEQYLKGVIPYEIGNDSPLEALKAQAVAARSEAVMALISKMYSGPHHDLTADVECQVFSGNRKRTTASDSAVEQTRGLIISENGKAINAYYASNCGGHSELIKNVWPERPRPATYKQAGSDNSERKQVDLSDEAEVRKWISSAPNVFCNPNLGTELPPWSIKNFRWTRNYSIVAISEMLSNEQDFGMLLNIKALQRGPSGRIYHARFVFEKDSIEIKGELAIRQKWHPALRSSCFVVDKDSVNFILNGAGWGHGVGMCQSGAVAQAKQGRLFTGIIEHYYPSTRIISIYQKK